MGIPALCFTQAGNSSRLFISHSAPPPPPPEGVLVSPPPLASSCLPALLLLCRDPSAPLYLKCWCILTSHLGSLPLLSLFLLPGHQPPPVCIRGLLMSVELSCLGLQAGLSSCLPHVFTFKSFWSYSSWTGGELTVISPRPAASEFPNEEA